MATYLGCTVVAEQTAGDQPAVGSVSDIPRTIFGEKTLRQTKLPWSTPANNPDNTIWNCAENISKHEKYSALSIYRGHFSLKSSWKTPHSLPVRARYGVSFVIEMSDRSFTNGTVPRVYQNTRNITTWSWFMNQHGNRHRQHRHNFYIMMTSSNGSIFHITGPLWGESAGYRLIPLTKASDMELWCLLWSAPEQTAEQTI